SSFSAGFSNWPWARPRVPPTKTRPSSSSTKRGGAASGTKPGRGADVTSSAISASGWRAADQAAAGSSASRNRPAGPHRMGRQCTTGVGSSVDSAPMASDAPSHAGDERRLQGLGYAQELKRTLGFFASFGIAFCYVSPVVGVYTLFGYGLSTGGPAFVWGLPIVVGGQALVVLVFSEVAATYPLAGALYQWARRLVGPRYGWFVGWLYGWALIVTIAAV